MNAFTNRLISGTFTPVFGRAAAEQIAADQSDDDFTFMVVLATLPLSEGYASTALHDCSEAFALLAYDEEGHIVGYL